MKRVVRLLALCLIVINLSACTAGQEQTASVTSFPPANFNNNYWFSGDFWAFEDTVFYLQDGFYNMGAYWSAGQIRSKLFEEADFSDDSTGYTAIGDIFVCGSFLYFELTSDRGCMLYRYDLAERTYAPVCETPRLYRWVVADNRLIYTEHPLNSSETHTPLWLYNLNDGTSTQICADIEEFGIVDGQVRYITYTDSYELFQYDCAYGIITPLGEFSPEFDKKYDLFNFTSDSVVMLNWERELDQNLVVYTLSSDSTAVYTLPKGIQHLVAYDQYAYAVLYDTQKYSSDAVASKNNGIYRINLTDGSYEVVAKNADNDTEIHVISDDRIYIIQRKMNLLFQSRRHVYVFDYMTRTKVKLAVI